MSCAKKSGGRRSLWAVAVCLLALAVLPGCTLLNESSAKERAGTYDVATTLEVDPNTGVVSYHSTGDDELSIDSLERDELGVRLAGLQVKQRKSEVLRAQGERAQGIEGLMAQQIQLNAVWGQTLVSTLGELRGIASDLSTLTLELRRLQSQTTAPPADTTTEP